MATSREILDHRRDYAVDGFQASLDRSLEVCDLLEALADDLPRRSKAVWREAKIQCRDVLQNHLKFGLEQFVPFLNEYTRIETVQHDVLSRFKAECTTLVDRLESLDDLFDDAVSYDRNCVGAEALGFALRSHFDGLRSHIGWEKDVLLPMAARISPSDYLTTASENECLAKAHP